MEHNAASDLRTPDRSRIAGEPSAPAERIMFAA